MKRVVIVLMLQEMGTPSLMGILFCMERVSTATLLILKEIVLNISTLIQTLGYLRHLTFP
jgi:hypothetical protein